MATKVLCPSLPDLLRKTVLTFCEGSVKFDRSLEVVGSLHIRSDNERVATFLLDEQLFRSDHDPCKLTIQHGSQQEGDFTSNYGSSGDYHGEGGFRPVDPEQGKNSQNYKKSRKTLKPVRKINFPYSQGIESSDNENDDRAMAAQEQGQASPPRPVESSAPHPPSFPSEGRHREHEHHSEGPETCSEMEGYGSARKQSLHFDHHASSTLGAGESQPRIVSPMRPVVLEASSTRPDDMLPPSHISITSESSQISMDEGMREYSREASVDMSYRKNPSPVIVKPEETQGPKYEYPTSGIGLTPATSSTSSNSGAVFTLSQTKVYSSTEQDQAVLFQRYTAAMYEAAYRASLQQSLSSDSGIESAPSLPSSFSTSVEEKMPYYHRSPDPYHHPPSRESSLTSPVALMYHSGSRESMMSPALGAPPAGQEHDPSQGDAGESWEKAVPCQECGRVLKSERMLELHMNTAHTHKTVYPCKQCGKVFYAASSLHSHKKRTHTSIEQKYKCPHCPRCYAFQSELLRHIDTAHSGLSPPKPPLWRQSAQSQPSPTPTTPILTQPSEMSSQESLSGPSLPQESESTETSVLGPSMKTEEGPMADDDQAEDPRSARPIKSPMGLRFKCNECGMLLKSRECLALHMNAKHTQKQAYPCTVCGRVFYAPSSRFCHMRRVHASKEQKFNCNYCDKVFTFHYELRNHMKLMHRNKLIQRSDGICQSMEGNRENGGDNDNNGSSELA